MSAKSSRASKQQRMRRGVALLAGCAVLLSGIGVLTGIWIERAKLQRDQARIEILSRVSAQLGNQESLARRAAGLAGLEMLARSNQSDAEFLNLICDILQGFIDERAPKHEDSGLLRNLVKIEISHTDYFSLEPGAIIRKMGLRGPEAARLRAWDASWRTHKREVEQAIIAFSSIVALNDRISNYLDLEYRYLPELQILPDGQIDLRKVNFFYSFLPEAYLARTNLEGAFLGYANFRSANLTESNLTKASLYETILVKARLGDATLRNANLSGANLKAAQLEKADLAEARLQGANLTEANLNQADLTATDLAGANLTGALLNQADLTATDLSKANLTSARLEEANLRNADLTEAKLTKVRLYEADLTEAKLIGVDLRGAIFCGTILQGARINNIQLAGAIYYDYEEASPLSCRSRHHLQRRKKIVTGKTPVLGENPVTPKWLLQQMKRN